MLLYHIYTIYGEERTANILRKPVWELFPLDVTNRYKDIFMRLDTAQADEGEQTATTVVEGWREGVWPPPSTEKPLCCD